MRFAPHRITRYVIAELLGPTVLGLSVCLFFLLMNHFLLTAEKALSKNLPADLTLELFVIGIPNLLVLAIPMSVLYGTLIGVGRLSADYEWVALQGAGQGPWRLVKPVVIHGLMWSLIAFTVYAVVSPRANYRGRSLRGAVLFASSLAADIKPRVFYTGLPQDAVIFVEEIKAGSDRLDDVLFIQTKGESEDRLLYLARGSKIYPAPDQSGDLIVDLYDGVAYEYDPRNPEVAKYSSHYDAVTQVLPSEEFIKRVLEPPNKGVQDLTFRELWDDWKDSREAWVHKDERAAEEGRTGSRASEFVLRSKLARATVELQQRLALPAASLSLALLALPLGIRKVRSGKAAGFALSLLVIVLYRAVFLLTRNQALAGRFPAFLGPWFPNLLVLAWALWALWRMRRAFGSGATPWTLAVNWVLERFRGRSKNRGRVAQAVVEGASSEGLVTRLLNVLMTRLDWYVGALYLRMVAYAVVAASLIYLLVETQSLVEGMLRNGHPFSMLFTYIGFFWPGILPVVLPVACLMGAVVAFSMLGRSGELTPIKAGGMSLRRITLPVIGLTGLLCIVLFGVQDRLVPGTSRRAQSVKDTIMGRSPRSYGGGPAGHWSFGPERRRLYNYTFYDTKDKSFQGLTVFDIDRETFRITDHRHTERAVWNGEAWDLEGMRHRRFADLTFEVTDETVTLPLDPPENFDRRARSLAGSSNLPDQMSLKELDEQIRSLEGSGLDTTKLSVAYHGKLARAMTPLVMVLLGVPFAFRVGRRGSLYGVGIALLLVLVYWATFAVFNALGLETLLDPLVAAWAPNLLFALVGVYLMLYIRT
ncbi:MAG: YjgP/YjgQ family permease [bacterium]|nr:YjgP/YjgQ family permease [bacterium]